MPVSTLTHYRLLRESKLFCYGFPMIFDVKYVDEKACTNSGPK